MKALPYRRLITVALVCAGLCTVSTTGVAGPQPTSDPPQAVPTVISGPAVSVPHGAAEPGTRAADWNGYVVAKASASSGGSSSNPADDSLSFTVKTILPHKRWVPTPPATEAAWNTDALNYTWHAATMSSARGRGKAKAGLNANGSVCVDARAEAKGGFGDQAWGYGKARMSRPVMIAGPGPTAEAEVTTGAYVAAPGEPTMCAASAETSSPTTLPANTVLLVVHEDVAEAKYPQLIAQPYPGAVAHSELLVNEEPVAYSSVTMYQEQESAPIVIEAEGDLATVPFLPWLDPGPEGQWPEDEEGDRLYYATIRQTLHLPTGYEFVPVPDGCPDSAITIVLMTDDYPGETSWEVIERDTGTAIASSPPDLEPARLYSWDVCVDSTSCYDFTIYDSFGDGICCDYGDGHYEVYYNGTLAGSGGVFSDQETVHDMGGGCGCPDGSVFDQPPSLPDEVWVAGNIEEAFGYIRYESFETAAEDIVGVQFWGLNAYYDGTAWSACDEDPMPFVLKFYDDAGGTPGAEVCSYDLLLTREDTGMRYHPTLQLPLYKYSAELDPPCEITSGWVSLQAGGDPECWMMWMNSQVGDGSSCLDPGDGVITCGQSTEPRSDFDLSLCLQGRQPFPEVQIASLASEWGALLERGMQGEGGIVPIVELGAEEMEEIAELGMEPHQFRPARLYPVEDLDETGMDGLVMAFGDDPVPEGDEVVAGFDYMLGYDFPAGYGFWTGHDHDDGLRWCYRRLQFWNYWRWPWYWPPWYWWNTKLIVFYDINGNRLLIDYKKWWRWWPWPYRYWWKYRIYPYYPWPWSWWRPYQSYRVIGPFNPWRVVRIRYWETAYWWYRPPYPWVDWPYWPWPLPKDSSDGGPGMRGVPPDVPWNAWGDMGLEETGTLPTCTEMVCDADRDSDVDLRDFAVFQRCFRNPDGYDESCTCLDRDENGEVEIVDYVVFSENLTGPQ